MYYEEKVIGGQLMYRTSPGGNWSQASIQKLNETIVFKDQIIDNLRLELKSLYDASYNHGYENGKNDLKQELITKLGLEI